MHDVYEHRRREKKTTEKKIIINRVSSEMETKNEINAWSQSTVDRLRFRHPPHRMLSVHFSLRFVFIYVLALHSHSYVSFGFRAILFDLILIECFPRRLNCNTAHEIHENRMTASEPRTYIYLKRYNNYGERRIKTIRGCGCCGAHLLNRSRWALVVRSAFLRFGCFSRPISNVVLLRFIFHA